MRGSPNVPPTAGSALVSKRRSSCDARAGTEPSADCTIRGCPENDWGTGAVMLPAPAVAAITPP